MTMLPDIDAQSWDLFSRERLQRELQSKVDSFGLEQAINEKIAGVQGLLGGNTEPAVPAPVAAPAPEAFPEPEVAPGPTAPPPAPAAIEPPPEPEPPPNLPTFEPEPPPARMPQPDLPQVGPPPVRLTQPAIAPSGPPPARLPSSPVSVLQKPQSSAPDQDWMANALGAGLNAVQAAGGDVESFARSYAGSLGGSPQDVVAGALNAAHQSGADLDQFLQRFQLPARIPIAPSRFSLPSAGDGAVGPAAANASQAEVRDYIVQAARQRGIDPDIALRVAQSEGGFEPARRGTFSTGSSWWPFQLHYGGQGYEQLGNVAGMGNRFTAETGYQPGDPAAWRAATDYALDEAKRSGWGQWYGAKAQGITGYQGIDRNVPDATTSQLLQRVGGWAVPNKQVSQFGDPQLTSEEAYSACGPAAAVRFAQQFGRNPTLREATDLAKTVGWRAGAGMAGITSQQALMTKLGIPTKLIGPDMAAMAREASTGNPVTISTDGHYFFADGFDPNSGAFHVGQSGLDLRGGSEWMTPAQMEARMGKIQGALLADNPQSPAPSTADQDTNPLAFLGRAKDAVTSWWNTEPELAAPDRNRLTQPAVPDDPDVLGLDQAIARSGSSFAIPDDSGIPPVIQPPAPAPVQEEPQSPVDRLKSAFGDFVDSLSGASKPAPPEMPSLGIPGEIAGAAAQSVGERLGGIERLETGNPLVDLPLAIPSAAASALGTSVKAAGDVTNEFLPTTHLARLWEGVSGEARRDPQFNALYQQLFDLQGQLATAESGSEQELIRQRMRITQDQADQRAKQLQEESGVTDLESAYRAGLASPDRPVVEAIASVPAIIAGAGIGSAPGAAGTVGRILTGDPTVLAGPAGRVAARQLGQTQVGTALRLGTTTAGGAAGYASAPEDASPEERALRTALGAGAAALGTEAAIRGAPKLLYQRAPKSNTGHAGLDEVMDMIHQQDESPGLLSQTFEGLADQLGLAGRVGDLDRQVADKFAYINQLTGRAKQAMGNSFTPEMDAEAMVAAYAGRGARAKQRVKNELEPALDLVRGNDDIDHLNAYRKLQRDIEVANLNGGVRKASAGVKDAADAQDRLNALEQVVGPIRWRMLRQADDMLNKATEGLLWDRVNAGLIDADLAQTLVDTMPHFNPTVLLKYLDESSEGVSSGGKGLQVGGNLLKRLADDGSEDSTEKAIRSLTRFFVQNDVLINRNETAKAIIKAAQADPSLVDDAGKPLVKRVNPMQTVTGPQVSGPGGQVPPGDIATVLQRRFGDWPGHMSVYEDGKRVYYQIPEELETAVKNLDNQTTNLFLKGMQALNSPLRWGATAASPPFLVTNALADAVTTYMREGAQTAGRIPLGWWAAAKQNDLYQDYIKAGGGMESLYQRSAQDLDKLVEDSGGLLVRNQSDLARITKDALTLQWIRRAGEVIEQGPRLATFERHLARGESPAQAALAGRRATVDFSRSGEAIQQANQMSLFLNARVQGQLNTWRTLRDNPESRARLMALAAMNAGLYAYNRQYPEYWDVPKYIRDTNAVIMLPGSEKDPNGPGYKKLNYLAVPLREWSAFTAPQNYALAKIDREHGDEAFAALREQTGGAVDIPALTGKSEDPRNLREFGTDYANRFSPLAGDDLSSSAGGLFPAPIRTPVETQANRRFYTGLPIVPEHMKDLPPSQQWDDRTSLVGRKLGEKLGISPKVFDFVINENFGGLGRTALGASDQVTDWVTQARGGEVPPAESPPIIGGLTSGVFKTYGGQQRADAYDKLNELMGQWEEPFALVVRQMPEYANATRDDQDSMLRTAMLELRETFANELGIPKTTRDVGLPDKYAGVSDPQLELKIDEAISRFNAWEQDPVNNAEPTEQQVELYAQYRDAIDPLYRVEKRWRDQRQAGIRKVIDERAPQLVGR